MESNHNKQKNEKPKNLKKTTNKSRNIRIKSYNFSTYIGEKITKNAWVFLHPSDRRLRARRALTQFNNVPLKTRRALLP